MKVMWTARANADLKRVHEFLVIVSPHVAAEVVKQIFLGADRLQLFPHLGTRLENYEPREIRRVMIGDYELRYEIANAAIYIVRLWHSREDR